MGNTYDNEEEEELEIGLSQPKDLAVAGSIEAQERHEGYSVLNKEQFDRLYHTDIRAMGADSAATFNFQGYRKRQTVDWERKAGHPDMVYEYRDVLATNGILKAPGHKGIHVGTDGMADYNDSQRNDKMKPGEVMEYTMFIQVPGPIQKEQGCVVKYDSCRTVEEFDPAEGELDNIYKDPVGEYIVLRLHIDPEKDPLARKKVEIIHDMAVKFIEHGGKLYDIADLVREWEGQLNEIDDANQLDSASRKLLESGD